MKMIKEFWCNLSMPMKFAYSWVIFLLVGLSVLCAMNWEAFGAAVFIVILMLAAFVATVISIGAVIAHIID